MKFVIVILLALAAKGHCGTHADSWEEDNRGHSSLNVQKEINALLMATSEEYNSHWQSPASSLAGASAYKMKVTKRIKNSNALSGMKHLKEHLYQIADEKLEQCVNPNNPELDKNCVGRVTGQIMQLIAAVEKSSRSTTYTGYRKHASKDSI